MFFAWPLGRREQKEPGGKETRRQERKHASKGGPTSQILFRDPRGSGACKINARPVLRTPGPWSGRHDTCFAQFKFPAAPPAPRGTMLKGTEWIRSCKRNAHICFECPAHRLSTLYKGGRGGRRKLGTLKKKTSATDQGSVSPQDRTSVYFASTGIRVRPNAAKPGRRSQTRWGLDGCQFRNSVFGV